MSSYHVPTLGGCEIIHSHRAWERDQCSATVTLLLRLGSLVSACPPEYSLGRVERFRERLRFTDIVDQLERVIAQFVSVIPLDVLRYDIRRGWKQLRELHCPGRR